MIVVADSSPLHYLILVRDIVARLQATNFYVDEGLLRTVFARWLEA